MTSLPLSVQPRAEREALKAARWYEREAAGLGRAFLESVEQALLAVEENPYQSPELYRDIRRALVKRFPYGVFFRIRPQEVRVLAILHLARDPERWRGRR
jgi:toxin ParE1/3/4